MNISNILSKNEQSKNSGTGWATTELKITLIIIKIITIIIIITATTIKNVMKIITIY